MVDVRGFNGGLNTDAGKELLPSGDYTYAYNIENGPEGIINLPGNTLLNGAPRPTLGIEWICGSFFDKTRQRIIYFTHNNKGYHRIISVDMTDNTHTVLFEDNPFATEIVSVTTTRTMTFFNFNSFVTISGASLNLKVGDVIELSNTTLFSGPGNNDGIYTVVDFNYNVFSSTNFLQLGGGGTIFAGSGGTIKYNSVLELGSGAFNWDLYDAFDANGLIKDIKVIHREYEGDLYYFIDPKKNLSKFNYDTLLDWTTNNVAIKSDYFNVIKAPPKDIIGVDVIDDENYRINNLYQKLFQFKYRFVYDDNEKSVWSAISKIPLPSNSTDALYNVLNNVQNCIELKLWSGDINVSKIEIAGRVNIESEWSDFFLIDTIVKERDSVADNTVYKYIFKNDSVYTPIDLQESNLLFDYVPDECNALELANGNTLVVGGIKDGYNRDLNLDVLFTSVNAESPTQLSTLDFQLKDASGSGPFTPLEFNNGFDTYTKYVAGTVQFSGNPEVGDLITIVISGVNGESWDDGIGSSEYTERSIDWTYSIVVQSTWGIPEIINAFNSYPSLPGSYNITADSVNHPSNSIVSSRPSKPFGTPDGTVDPNTLYFGSFVTSGPFDTKRWSITSVSVNIRRSYSFIDSDVFPTYKWNGLYKFGLVYYDKNGKTNGVFTKPSMTLRTGSYNTSNEWTPIGFPPILPENETCQIYIGHEPPEWADYYHIVRTKDLSCDFSLMVISSNTTDKDNSGYVFLDIQNIADTNVASKETSLVINYGTTSFVPGDRVRIYQKYDSVTKSVTWDDKEFLDLPIFSVETVSSRLRLKVKDVDTSSNPSLLSLANSDKTVIEIYRPSKVLSNEDLVYYEIGYKFNIVRDEEGNRYHDGQSIVENQIIASYNASSLTIGSVVFSGDTLSFTASKKQVSAIINGIVVGDFISISGNPSNDDTAFEVKEITKVNDTDVVIRVNGTFVFSIDNGITINRVTKPDTKYAYINMFGDGDYYYKTRTMICDTTTTNFGALYVADKNFSETYLSAVWGQGRPLIVDENIKEEYYPAMLRFSQSYIYGTNINNVSRFYPNNFEEADASFGPILRLKTRENFIRMFQRYKVGMIPIYRQIIIDNASSSQVALSERLLNKPNYYSGEYGIDKYGSSLISTDYGDYFVDTINKAIVRVSLDGITNISDTNNLSAWSNQNIKEDSYGYGCFNYENRNVILLIGRTIDIPGINTPQVENFIISYDEPNKNFESFYGYNKAQSILFINGLIYTLWSNIAAPENSGYHLYVHNNETRNFFFGEQQYSQIKTVFNGNVQLKKTYIAIEELSNGLWTGGISTGPLIEYYTTLNQSDFTKTYLDFTTNRKENKFNATIKRNLVSGDKIEINKKYTGEPMKGLWAEVELNNSLTTPQRLISVSLKYIPSPLTNS